MMQKVITNSEEETRKFAQSFAQSIKSNIYALSGNLGAGKTTFVQGFAKGLGIKDKIISPTFVLIRQHQIPNTKKVLYHIDLYRLENLGTYNELGLKEIFSDPNAIVVIEWAEKLTTLPNGTIKISIEKVGEQKRVFTVLF